MRCKQGDLARVVAPAELELRGRIVRCVELVYSFAGGKVVPTWITDRWHLYHCSRCHNMHESNRFDDEELEPLPGLPEEDNTDSTIEDEVTA